jgi:alpha-1,6-mannosyltransferase
MAANIVAVLGGNMQAMGDQARAHALQFSWDQSMERLFGRVYGRARVRAAERASTVAAKGAGALVSV